MVGAHTDSPCLRLKPNPDLTTAGYLHLSVEVYGGILLNPWFDRDLSLAGRVTIKTTEGIVNELIDFVANRDDPEPCDPSQPRRERWTEDQSTNGHSAYIDACQKRNHV